jgi:hypothetical protein
LSVFDLSLLIVEIIRKLCVSEPGDGGGQTCAQAATFALEQLCGLQFGAYSLGTRDSELKARLVRLLLTSLSRVVLHAEATAVLLQNGTLPLLVRVLEDAVRKCPEDADFVHGTAHALLCFLLHAVQQNDRFVEYCCQFLNLINI